MLGATAFIPVGQFETYRTLETLGFRFDYDFDITWDLDSGNLSSYGLYVAYEIHSHVSLYIDYSYRSIKTNIKAPQGLESFFEKGTYNTIGFGVMFIMGKRDLVSRFLN